MKTTHRVFVENSNDLSQIGNNKVELVVTSPPCPMIKMGDGLFFSINSNVESALEAGDDRKSSDLMHEELNGIWDDINRVLVAGGIAYINIGDATRKVDGSFRVYPNHTRINRLF